MDREEYLRKKRERRKQYCIDNPEKVREQKRQYHLRHQEQINAKTKDWYRKNTERALESSKNWREENPDKARISSQKWREKNREQIRFKRYSKQGILNLRQYPIESICEICGQHSDKRLVMDHCHKSLQFRGWICHRCNLALGNANDDAELLMKLANYLKVSSANVKTILA